MKREVAFYAWLALIALLCEFVTRFIMRGLL